MYRYAKRAIDFVMAVVLMLIFLIPMVIIGIVIKLDSKGPVFFKQVRTGKNGKEFLLYKFRSMAVDNDVHDFGREDKHTKVGTFLRKTSLDELPQLINILNGDMSFIGPRPWIPDYYQSMDLRQRHRYDVLPGITGLAQAKGRNDISIFTKINYDLEYVRNLSLSYDIKVVLWTIQTVLSKAGADAGKGTIQLELETLRTQELQIIREDDYYPEGAKKI